MEIYITNKDDYISDYIRFFNKVSQETTRKISVSILISLLLIVNYLYWGINALLISIFFVFIYIMIYIAFLKKNHEIIKQRVLDNKYIHLSNTYIEIICKNYTLKYEYEYFDNIFLENDYYILLKYNPIFLILIPITDHNVKDLLKNHCSSNLSLIQSHRKSKFIIMFTVITLLLSSILYKLIFLPSFINYTNERLSISTKKAFINNNVSDLFHLFSKDLKLQLSLKKLTKKIKYIKKVVGEYDSSGPSYRKRIFIGFKRKDGWMIIHKYINIYYFKKGILITIVRMKNDTSILTLNMYIILTLNNQTTIKNKHHDIKLLEKLKNVFRIL